MNKPLLKLTLPLKIPVSKKKFFILNMNNYRNLHYRVLSSAKNHYRTMILRMMSKRKNKIKQTPLMVRYDYYHGSNRKHDLMNMISVIDKFALDAIVSSGVIEDDNTDIIKAYYLVSHGVDKNNPRAEMRVYPHKGDI